MKNAFNKEILRSITRSIGRFVAILIIVALGAGFCAGLRMTAPDMRLAADMFYDESSLYDVRVLSTMGLTEEDVDVLRGIEGVETVMPGHQLDMVTEIVGGHYVTRIHSVDTDFLQKGENVSLNSVVSEEEGFLNRPILTEGRWIQNPGECVLAASRIMNPPVKIGDKVQVQEGILEPEEAFELQEYTIVGFVISANYHAHTLLGSTSISNGNVQQYMYIAETDFKADFMYTEALISVSGAKEKFSGSDEYFDHVSTVLKKVQALAGSREKARLKGIKGEAQADLDGERAKYEDERVKAEEKLDQAKQDLEKAENDIAANERALHSGTKSFNSGVNNLVQKSMETELALAQAKDQLDKQQASLNAASAQLAAAQGELNAAWQTWSTEDAQCRAAEAALDQNAPEYIQTKASVEAWCAALNTAQADLNQKQASINAQAASLSSAQGQLDASRAALEEQSRQARAAIASGEKQLNNSSKKITDGGVELAEGQLEYDDSLKTYEENLTKAQADFAEAEQELAEAQKKIDEIEKPYWYVMDRTKNAGAESFQLDTTRMDQLSLLFPALFFFVAALVALTTMTRMVDEERVLIGTYKALGYSGFRIASKYLAYGFLASGLGSLVGIIILSKGIPFAVFEAYSMMYDFSAQPMPVDIPIALFAIFLGVGTTLLSTWVAIGSTLRESPAALMLPRAPKPGKRIFLERITPLWRRLSFSMKVSIRNIFRYKRRFVMTIIGIAGCCGLLLTGLGPYNAINDILDKQFNDVRHWNTVIRISDDITAEDRAGVEALLANKGLIYESTAVHDEHVTLTSHAGRNFGVYIVVPENESEFENFLTMRNRISREDYSLDDTSAIITEKAADVLRLKVGDTFTVTKEDIMGNPIGETYTLTVGGIMENYLGSQVYMSPEYFSSVFEDDFKYSIIWAKSTDDRVKQDLISDTLLDLDGVLTVTYSYQTVLWYESVIKSVGSIVWLLILAAMALAFVVLYNLTNINITERKREIATLKVLGFLPREVNAYIFREMLILTAVGALIGLVFGAYLEGFVIATAEGDHIMFGRDIHPSSFVIAFGLTMLYSIIVALIMQFKLKRIDMVESLKSVD